MMLEIILKKYSPIGEMSLFAKEYAEAVKISIKAVKGAILAIVVGNGIPEAIVAAVISTAVCTALFTALRNRH